VTSVSTVLRRIFICYRFDDTGAVADRLASELPRTLECEVFLDHRSLGGGEVWTEQIRHELERADVVLVLIGKQWLTLQASDGVRRLDDPNDWVRQEIERALETGKTIIPILIDGASPVEKRALRTFPSMAIEAFADRQVVHLASRRWDGDFASLVETLTRQGFRRKPVAETGASPTVVSPPVGTADRADDPAINVPARFPTRALIAGMLTGAVMAIATWLNGISVPMLEAWDPASTVIVGLLVTVIAGSGAFYLLKGQNRGRSLCVAAIAGAGCAYAWYTYGAKAAAPARVDDVLTWNGTLYVLYLTGFALCAAAINAVVRVVAPRA
jgi:hypothetical protein